MKIKSKLAEAVADFKMGPMRLTGYQIGDIAKMRIAPVIQKGGNADQAVKKMQQMIKSEYNYELSADDIIKEYVRRYKREQHTSRPWPEPPEQWMSKWYDKVGAWGVDK